MYLLFYLHLTESLYQLTTQNKVLTITTLHQSSDNPATTRRSPGPNTKHKKKDELIILGSPLGPKSQADLLEKKIFELEKVNGIVEKLDAHYGYLC